MLLGNSVAADASSIERGLQQLWRYEGDQDQSGQPLLCSRTLNLIICCSRDEQLKEIWELLGPISTRHPCRTLLIDTSGTQSSADLNAQVSATCLMSHEGNRYVGQELVAIAASHAADKRVASLVQSLLVPELPVFLWWRDMSNLESELLGLLAAHATRIIVDSGALTDSFKEFARLIALRQRYPSAAISDLAWARLTPWRQLTAQFFDGPMLSELQNLSHLSIGYVSDPKLESTPPAEALLLAGWLVKQLRCATGISQQTPTVVKRQNLLIWHFDRPGGSFRVQVRPEAEVGIGITSLKLACSDLQPCARFLISRGEKNLTAITELPRREPVRRVVRHGPHATGDAVCRELEILGHDNLYERVLEISAELGSTAA